jgi:hypothetical protein
MSFIHRTTMTPTKLELLDGWLPRQPWFQGRAARPQLSRVGGFRLDDPAGEVGLEFMVVRDESGDTPLTYHVPLTYRDAALSGAEGALLGTAEHGVLGKRWVYDGVHDPVLVAQLFALLAGEAEPQAQNVSDTPDPSVVAELSQPGLTAASALLTVTDGADGTALETDAGVTVRVCRILRPATAAAPGGHVTTAWDSPDGTRPRASFVTVHPTTP